MVVEVCLVDGVPGVDLADDVACPLQVAHQRLDLAQLLGVVQTSHVDLDQLPAAGEVAVFGLEPLAEVRGLGQEPNGLEPSVEEEDSPGAVADTHQGQQDDADFAQLEGQQLAKLLEP